MSWGAGLQVFGAGVADIGSQMHKEKLAAKLEKDKQANELAVKLADDAREQARLAKKPVFSQDLIKTNPDGTQYVQHFNEFGVPIDGPDGKRDVTAEELDAKKKADQKEADEATIRGLTIKSDQFTTDHQQETQNMKLEDQALQRRQAALTAENTRSEISYRQGSLAERAAAHKADSVASSESDYAKVLTDQFPDLRKQYTTPNPQTGEAIMTDAQFDHLALGTVRTASLNHKDAAVLFRNVLNGYVLKSKK